SYSRWRAEFRLRRWPAQHHSRATLCAPCRSPVPFLHCGAAARWDYPVEWLWSVFLWWAGVRWRKKCEWAHDSSQSIASCANGWPNWLSYKMKRCATDHGKRGKDSAKQSRRNRESDRADSRNESGSASQRENRATVTNCLNPGGIAAT